MFVNVLLKCMIRESIISTDGLLPSPTTFLEIILYDTDMGNSDSDSPEEIKANLRKMKPDLSKHFVMKQKELPR